MVIRRETKRGAHEERRVAKARGRRQAGRMPRTPEHLPADKRAELAFVVEVLTAGFDEERSTRWAKHLKPPIFLKPLRHRDQPAVATQPRELQWARSRPQ